MAKNDNWIDFLTEIADAIREKNGTSDPINAQDFADEIKNIAGDNGGSSASPIKEYYLYNNNMGLDANTALMFLNVEGFFIKGVYHSGKYRSFEPDLTTMALGSENNFGENGFIIGSLKGLQYISANDEGVGMLEALEHAFESGDYGDMGSMTPIDFLAMIGLTPCTKEEYEALLLPRE